MIVHTHHRRHRRNNTHLFLGYIWRVNGAPLFVINKSFIIFSFGWWWWWLCLTERPGGTTLSNFHRCRTDAVCSSWKDCVAPQQHTRNRHTTTPSQPIGSFRLPHIRSLKGGTQDGERLLLLLLLLHLSSERRSHLDCNHESINHRFEPYPGYRAASTTPLLSTPYTLCSSTRSQGRELCVGLRFSGREEKKYPAPEKGVWPGMMRGGTVEEHLKLKPKFAIATAVPHGARTS